MVRIVTWEEYASALNKLYQQVATRRFDDIVAIGRGGCIVAAFLASKLGVPAFRPVFIRHVGRGEEMKIVTHDIGQIKSATGRLLIVDDWLCEGRAMKYLLDLMPRDAVISTAVAFNRTGSEFKPDFVGAYVEKSEREILFPYDPV